MQKLRHAIVTNKTKQTKQKQKTAKEEYLSWTLKMQRNFENKKYSDCISCYYLIEERNNLK